MTFIHAVLTDNKILVNDAAIAMGIIDRTKAFDFDTFYALMRHWYQPFYSKKTFTFTTEFVTSNWDHMAKLFTKNTHVPYPKELLYINQLQWGLYAILADLIEDQLNLQVTMQFNHHHTFMHSTDLANCQSIMDIGTGNDTFISTLAKEYPHMTFIGVDEKADMIDRARQNDLSNITYMAGDINQPKKIVSINQVDGVLMRYIGAVEKRPSSALSSKSKSVTYSYVCALIEFAVCLESEHF